MLHWKQAVSCDKLAIRRSSHCCNVSEQLQENQDSCFQALKFLRNFVFARSFYSLCNLQISVQVIGSDGSTVCLDTTDENDCNWMCLVRTAAFSQEQNCMAYQLGSNIFYNTIRDIEQGEELRVWYAPHFARKLGKASEPDNVSKGKY